MILTKHQIYKIESLISDGQVVEIKPGSDNNLLIYSRPDMNTEIKLDTPQLCSREGCTLMLALKNPDEEPVALKFVALPPSFWIESVHGYTEIPKS